MQELEGKVALVTGCGRVNGLGRGICLALARAGADIVATDITADGTRNENDDGLEERRLGWRGLESLTDEIRALGRQALGLVGDVRSAADTQRFAAEAMRRFGRIDILVNNAAAPQGADRRSVVETPEEAWNLVIGVNLTGTFLMCKAVIPHMQKQPRGRIVNISSIVGKRGMAKRAAYTASKFGIVGITQTLAQELGASGITANVICPGPVQTSRYVASQKEREALANNPKSHALRSPPSGKFCTVEDIARVVLFVCADASDQINGQSLIVDGGDVML